MGFYERIEMRGAWETRRPVSFIPKGALTHHPEGAVVLPVATVRSARRMRLLREPYGQCHITAALLSSSTQLSQSHPLLRMRVGVQLVPHLAPTARINLPPAALFAVVGIACRNTHFLFAKKKQKQGREDGENEWRFTTWKQRS